MKSFDLNQFPSQIAHKEFTEAEGIQKIAEFISCNYPVFGLHLYDEDFRAEVIVRFLEKGTQVYQKYNPEIGDFFITVTGCKDVITEKAMRRMKNGAILCNAGHFNVEINLGDLEKLSVERFESRKNIMGYKLADGRVLHLIAEGRLVNLAAGDGHPVEIMDMSFAIQALSAQYLARSGKELPARLHAVPRAIDEEVARRKLDALGVSIDTLTDAQRAYLACDAI